MILIPIPTFNGAARAWLRSAIRSAESLPKEIFHISFYDNPSTMSQLRYLPLFGEAFKIYF